MAKLKLDKYEKELLDAYESDDAESKLTAKRIREVKKAADNTFKKDKRINIRISSRVLDAIQRRALEEGIPYQTLVSSVLYKYVSGGLQDASANKALQRTPKGRAE